MPRPIGQRIIETVEALEKLGPMTCLELAPHLPKPVQVNVRNLCSRAWSHGLASWTYDPKGRRVYKAIETWREVIHREPKPEARKVHIVPAMGEPVIRSWEGKRLVNSVFALAG